MTLLARFVDSKLEIRRQIFKVVGANFRIYGNNERQVFFCNLKGFKLKADIRIYADDQQKEELMTIQARQVLDFSAAYDVFDVTENSKVGCLKRKGWKSLARDEWTVHDASDREIGILIEDSMFMAMLRRFLSNLIPQNYDLIMDGKRMLDLRQDFNPFTYRLTLDFRENVDNELDPRLGLAAGILLAAIEGRQK